jgi:hypothetical protein
VFNMFERNRTFRNEMNDWNVPNDSNDSNDSYPSSINSNAFWVWRRFSA